jgi:4-hydroxybenzoate polyprenyltransferase
LAGIDLDFSVIYFVALGVAALLLVYQQFLIFDCVPEHCFVAFLNNHWVGAIIFFGIIGHYYASLPD